MSYAFARSRGGIGLAPNMIPMPPSYSALPTHIFPKARFGMPKRTSFLAVAVLLLVACSNALAWNSVGHMTVAYAAYQRLTPTERARVAVLLKLNPYYSKWVSFIQPGTSPADQDMYVFMMAATWPDEIRADNSFSGNDECWCPIEMSRWAPDRNVSIRCVLS